MIDPKLNAHRHFIETARFDPFSIITGVLGLVGSFLGPTLFGGAKTTPLPAVPSASNATTQAAERDAATAAATAAGRGSTILTSGLGDTSQAAIGRKVLLGG